MIGPSGQPVAADRPLSYFVAHELFKWPPRWVMLPQAPFEPTYRIWNFNTMPLYPILIGTRWLAWRRTAFANLNDRLLIRTGWWRRRILLLPLSSVQSVDLTHTLISRRFGIATLTIGVAGGSGFSGHSIPALPRERAGQLREALLSRFA